MKTIYRKNGNFFYFGALALLLLTWPSEAYPQAWKAEWDKTLAAAKKEGKVIVAGPPGQPFRVALTAFRQSHPDIQVDYVGVQGRDFIPRIMQERRAGQFLWDVLVGGASSMFISLMPHGVMDPLRPALILPEVLEDKNWRDGFEDGWMDQEKKYVYGFPNYLIFGVQVNRDVIPEADFTKAEDLWDARWRGKIVWHDPRGEGSGANQALMVMLNFGEEALRRLLKDQEIVVTKDYRQQAEWLVRGRYPIGLGVLNTVLWNFHKEGLGKNVKPLKDPKLTTATPGFGNATLINRAPHRNAATLYINWLLSKEGQSSYAKNTGDNSRRLDVSVINPELAPQAGVEYRNTMRQEYSERRKRVNQIAKEALR